MPPHEDEKHSLKLANKLRPLTALEGWKIYISILDEHINTKVNAVLSPGGGIDGVLKSEADKGAIMGLRLARGIVGSILQDADAISKKYAGSDMDLTGDE